MIPDEGNNLLSDVVAIQGMYFKSVQERVRRGNSRFVMRKGPLVIYDQDQGLTKAFRNIPGVECCQVDRLNLLQLAPGGHVGRLCIWTEGAFNKLDSIFGTFTEASSSKSGFTLPNHIMANADLADAKANGKTFKRNVTSRVGVLLADHVERLDPSFLPVATLSLKP